MYSSPLTRVFLPVSNDTDTSNSLQIENDIDDKRSSL